MLINRKFPELNISEWMDRDEWTYIEAAYVLAGIYLIDPEIDLQRQEVHLKPLPIMSYEQYKREK